VSKRKAAPSGLRLDEETRAEMQRIADLAYEGNLSLAVRTALKEWLSTKRVVGGGKVDDLPR
jgi:hypothetical protein